MITEDYVSFETSKLLKEKGFNEPCRLYYDKYHGYIPIFVEDGKLTEYGYKEHARNDQNSISDFIASAPSLYVAMKWLREVHDLHIITYPWKADKEERATHWCCKVYKSFNLFGYEKYTDETPKSYEEACEAGIKFCLKNLI